MVVNAIWTSIAAHSPNSFQFAVGERRKGTEVKKYERERETFVLQMVGLVAVGDK